jgi:hypothetical protein
MIFYKMESKFGKEVGNTYPQSQSVKSEINVNSSIHLLNQWGKFPENVYIPDSVLDSKAILTDLISSSPIYQKIVSDKLKNILFSYRKIGIQFFSTNVLSREKKTNYWLLNEYEYDYEFVDYSNSEIIRSNDDAKTVLKIKSANEFIEKKQLFEKVNDSIWIEKLHLIKDINKDILFLDKVSGSNIYLSQKIKDEIESKRCTGIEFVKCGDRYP